MRALTQNELSELRDGCSDIESNVMYVDAVCALVKRGLLEYTCDGDYHYTTTTERGKLALRVHESYLASR